jgi:hypothetical protein
MIKGRNLNLDLLRKSGEFPVSDEELHDAATRVYEGISGGSGPPNAHQRSDAARDRGDFGDWSIDAGPLDRAEPASARCRQWRLLVADGRKAGHTSSQPSKNLIRINLLNRSQTSSAEIGVIVSRRYQSGEISNTLGK